MKNRQSRLKAPSFVPSVAEIAPDDVERVGGLESVVMYWTDGDRPAAETIRNLHRDFGGVGFCLERGEDVLGFLVYGPSEGFSRSRRYPVGPLESDAVILAYVEGDPRARRRLLVRMMRDLRSRGVGRVEAIASDAGSSRHVSTGFLLDNGWRPVRSGWFRGKRYTLARVDLGNAVEAGELAKGLLGRVKLPKLASPRPAPGALTSVELKGAESPAKLKLTATQSNS